MIQIKPAIWEMTTRDTTNLDKKICIPSCKNQIYTLINIWDKGNLTNSESLQHGNKKQHWNNAALTECRKLDYPKAKNKWIICKHHLGKIQPYIVNRQKKANNTSQKRQKKIPKKDSQSLIIFTDARKINKLLPFRHPQIKLRRTIFSKKLQKKVKKQYQSQP